MYFSLKMGSNERRTILYHCAKTTLFKWMKIGAVRVISFRGWASKTNQV